MMPDEVGPLTDARVCLLSAIMVAEALARQQTVSGHGLRSLTDFLKAAQRALQRASTLQQQPAEPGAEISTIPLSRRLPMPWRG